MKICIKCNKEYNRDKKFCKHCGNQLILTATMKGLEDGIEYCHKNSFHEAIQIFDLIINDFPHNFSEKNRALLYFNWAIIKANELNKIDHELIQTIHTLGLNKSEKTKLCDIYSFIGNRFLSDGDPDNAKKYFQMALRIESRNDNHKQNLAKTFFYKCKVELKRNSLRNAIFYIDKSLEYDPLNDEYKNKRNELSTIIRKKNKRTISIISALIFVIVTIYSLWYSFHGNLTLKVNIKSEILVLKNNDPIHDIPLYSNYFSKKFLLYGKYLVKVSAEGYEPYSKIIKIGILSNIEESINLKPLFGSIKIDSVPKGVEVYINDYQKGRTPTIINNVLAKATKIELIKDCYYWEDTVLIEPNKLKDLKIIDIESNLINTIKKKVKYLSNANFLTQIYIELSDYYLTKKKMVDAKQMLDKAIDYTNEISEKKTRGWRYYNIVSTFLKMEELSLAKKIANKIIDKRIKNYAFKNISETLAKKGKIDEAIQILKTYNIDNSSDGGFFQLAMIEAKSNKINEANKILRLIHNSDYYINRFKLEIAKWQFQNDQHQKSNQYSNSLTKNQKIAEWFYAISKICINKKAFEKAQKNLNLAKYYAKKSDLDDYIFHLFENIIETDKTLNNLFTAKKVLTEFLPLYYKIIGNSYWKQWYQNNASRSLTSANAIVENFDEAKRIATSIPDDYHRKNALINIGNYMSQSGKFKEAKNMFESYVKKDSLPFYYRTLSKNHILIDNNIQHVHEWLHEKKEPLLNIYILLGILDAQTHKKDL